jgi:lysyl-tRNA synthetase class 2
LAQQDDSGRFEQQRQEKLAQIKEMGLDPYGGRYENIEPAESIRARFKDGDESQRARTAGRIVLLRDIGKLIFITLRDRSGTIQIGLAKNLMGEQWRLAKLLDLGDVIGAEGRLGKTKTGEITIWGEEKGLTLLSKSLCQPPEKFHGLADIDQRYRQRYVDLWVNPEVMDRFQKRSQIVRTIRQLLEARGFIEVETPMMQAIAGGAAAKPFVTHHNSLDLELYLRISPELFLKRLLVGGMERVFEINRNFRNEGIDRHHNPEFTMIEVYQAYGDYNVMMDLTEDLVSACLQAVGQGTKVQFGNLELDFTRPWRRAKYADLLKEYSGCQIDDINAIRAKARELTIEDAGLDDAMVVNEVFEATVEERLISPTFVIDYPAVLCPLAKPSRKDPQYAERFELFVAGMELANAYTELNDPALQYENFRHQLRGQEESLTKMDVDYVTALKVGMPPAGGLGIGIDRLVMVLTGATTIRDVVLFPLLKPATPGQL